jgi:hypothetical protein
MVYPIGQSIRNWKTFAYYCVMLHRVWCLGKESSVMIPFMKRFPELGPRETRTVRFQDDGDGIPRGSYALVEFYCEEEGCDCRRVLIQVIEESTPGKVWATISYGWDPSSSRTNWADFADLGMTASGAFLDPISPQSEYAEEFLEFFEWMITQDPAYVERLKRHYAMFKGDQPTRTRSWQTPHSESRAKRPKPEQLLKRKRP